MKLINGTYSVDRIKEGIVVLVEQDTQQVINIQLEDLIASADFSTINENDIISVHDDRCWKNEDLKEETMSRIKSKFERLKKK